MQSNGVIHENGTSSSSDFAVNGLVGVVKSNGCEESVLCGDRGEEGEGEEGVSGVSGTGGTQRVGSVHIRKRKPRQLSRKDTDIVRLIGQHLREMGFNNTLSSLVEESGCPLEHPKAATFRAHVIAGKWDLANESLEGLRPLLQDASNVEKMRLLLLTEKYLELLEGGQEIEALHCLRHELAPVPLHHSDKQLQLLTSYMMYSDKELLRKAANWPGLRGGAREQLMDKLQGYLSSSVMLPPKRLQQLLAQAVQLQVEKCPFHYLDLDPSENSLLTDHICTRAQFPSESVHILTDHNEEVWYVKFSHSGTMLASGSKDGQVIIWDVSGPRPTKRHTLKGQGDGIAVLDWSPDDSLLLCCGRDDNPEAIVFSTESGEVKCRVNHSPDDNLTCCAWHHNGSKFYVGGTRGQFLECSMDGSVTASWEGIRVQAMATHPTSDNVYAADTHHRIRQYNFRDKSSSTLVIENHSIMSFKLSKNGRNAILNVATQGIHLWDLLDRCLLRRYQGITQSLYAIYSCYGGIRESFLASGSEDHHVYVWHHARETPVVILKGHSRSVNCVDWNDVNPTMLASGSDDGSVRLWGTEEQMKAELEHQKERERLMEQLQQDSMQSADPLLGALAGSRPSRPRSAAEGEGSGDGGEGEQMEVVAAGGGGGEEEGESPAHHQSALEDPADPRHSSELDRISSSTSSLSLSNLRPVILDPLEPRQDSSESASSWSLSALDEAASRVHLSSLDFGSTPRVVVRERSGSAGTARRGVQMLTHESSVDQESSQLSQDSSNGSMGQVEELAEEQSSLSLDASLRFRTTMESSGNSPPSTSTPMGGGSPSVEAPPLTTPHSGGGGGGVRGVGRSVIVGGRTEGGGGIGGEGSEVVVVGGVSSATAAAAQEEESRSSGPARERSTEQTTPQGDSTATM